MAVEVWFLRRMLKISWKEKKNKEEVFKEAGVDRTLLKRVRHVGHVLRRHGLENLVVTGRIDGRRARRHQRLKYLNSLCNHGRIEFSILGSGIDKFVILGSRFGIRLTDWSLFWHPQMHRM